MYSDDESDENDEAQQEEDGGDPVSFPQTFIFSCIGLGLSNFARRQE